MLATCKHLLVTSPHSSQEELCSGTKQTSSIWKSLAKQVRLPQAHPAQEQILVINDEALSKGPLPNLPTLSPAFVVTIQIPDYWVAHRPIPHVQFSCCPDLQPRQAQGARAGKIKDRLLVQSSILYILPQAALTFPFSLFQGFLL